MKTHSQVLPPLGKLENLSYEFDLTFSVIRDYEYEFEVITFALKFQKMSVVA